MPNSPEPLNYFVASVFRFNRDVVGIDRPHIQPLCDTEAGWLQGALIEESSELIEASILYDDKGEPFDNPDPEAIVIGQVDACVDAAIFAIGGLARLGLTEEQATRCLHAVMTANFEKKAGVKPGRTGAQDAIKPEGWVGPEARIKEILYGKR